MAYFERFLHSQLDARPTHYKVLLITGPRRSGKSTFAAELQRRWGGGSYHSFDTPVELAQFRADPESFLNSVRFPVVLDEVQNIPELFQFIKSRVDRQTEDVCNFILTGSQQFQMMSKVSESLAGRILIRELYPLAVAEARSNPVTRVETNLRALLREDREFAIPREYSTPDYSSTFAARQIVLGGYPQVRQFNDERSILDWFSSYVETYVQRDVRSLSAISDLATFSRFVALVAGRTAGIVNYSALGKDLGVSYKTSQHYLSLLEAGYLWHSVAPFFRAESEKRLTKSPKGFFIDTGLATYLMGIYTASGLDMNPLFGALFETFATGELKKLMVCFNERVTCLHFRADQKHEVDLVLERGQTLIPIEIKASGTPRPDWGRGITAFRKVAGLSETSPGYVLSLHPEIVPVGKGIVNLPLHLFL